MVFQLPANSHLIPSKYPLYRIWRLTQDPEHEETVNLGNGGEAVIVWRDDATILVEPLTQAEYFILNCFSRDLSLEKVCARAARNKNSIDVTGGLSVLAARGWLASFKIDRD